MQNLILESPTNSYQSFPTRFFRQYQSKIKQIEAEGCLQRLTERPFYGVSTCVCQHWHLCPLHIFTCNRFIKYTIGCSDMCIHRTCLQFSIKLFFAPFLICFYLLVVDVCYVVFAKEWNQVVFKLLLCMRYISSVLHMPPTVSSSPLYSTWQYQQGVLIQMGCSVCV